MLGRIDRLTLLVDDVRQCATFYREVLGFQQTDGDSALDGACVEFAHEGVRFAICSRRALAQQTGDPSFLRPRSGQVVELAFQVDGAAAVGATFEALIQRGARPVAPPTWMPWGQRTAFLADPDGNVFAIFAEGPGGQPEEAQL
jgi:catechol 2,3-dioxygenase-like lactoylglutathione lyase family enzyme